MIPLAELLGESPGIQAVRATVVRLLARGGEGRRLPPILILGETGTGKGVLARALHRTGPRADGPLVELNCAAIPESLLEAELFGFERGAFTDARQPKAGLFQTAHGGTLFLDEVGLLPERVQAKFLKVVEDGAVRRLGSTKSEPVDVALVAATSEDLLDAVRQRRFREDLYHRLAVVTVRLPTLAERGADILLLADHFLARAGADYGLSPKTLTPDARAVLLAYPWPGNVRELANVMERAALLTETSLVTAEALGLSATSRPAGAALAKPARTPRLRGDIETTERQHVLEALRETDWNIARAAARLRIPRGTLRYRIEKLGLHRDEAPPTPAAPPVFASPPEPTPPPRGEPTLSAWPWERRQLAFLRATLVPASDRDAGLGPEIAGALPVLVEKVQSFGGRVEALGPLSLVAAFGLEPVEDAPRRAAHAAIAMRKAAERLRPPAATEPVGLRIAIHAHSGLVGETAGTLVIDVEATGRAYAMLETLATAAERGAILVSAVAARTLERRFALVPISLGSPADGPGYRLEGLEQTGLAPRGTMTPFVGRRPELEQVRHALARVAAGHGQVVAIVGEPGVGKSRLVWEVMQSHRGHGWLTLHMGAVSYGQAAPYWPVIQLLKTYFQIEERDDPSQIREKLQGRILALDPALMSSLDALLTLLDLPAEDGSWPTLDPVQRRQRTLDALKGLWLREAQIRPVLLVVEDLHWLDAETQALLDSLVAGLPTARLGLLVDYRPEYRHGWSSRTCYSQLRLDPLPPESAQELLRTLLGTDPGLDRLMAFLTDWTDGNPFFLEEAVQTLVETQALHGERGARSLARPIDTIQVPATVEAVLAARIDQLPAEARRLLQTAAVIGKDVSVGLLRAIAQCSEEALRRNLATLQTAELIYEARFVPDVEYTFKHALTHEVAYESLAPLRRAQLHTEIVEVIERIYPNRQAEQIDRLAHHAYRGEAWDKAVDYLRQASAKAWERSAYREAAACLEQALAALAHLPEDRETLIQAVDIRLDLWGRLGVQGRSGAALDHLRRAEHVARTLGDRYRLSRVLASLSVALRGALAATDQAVEAARDAAAIAAELGDADLENIVTLRLGQAYVSFGNFIAAEAALRRSLDTSDRLAPSRPRRLRRIEGLSWRSLALVLLGHPTEAVSQAEAAVRDADPRDDLYTFVAATTVLGFVHLDRRDLDQAIPVFERAVASAREWSMVNWTFTAMAGLGCAYALVGRFAEGLALAEQVVEQDIVMGIIGDIRAPHIRMLAEALFVAGRADEAEARARQALDLARAHGERGWEAANCLLLGRIASHRDPPDVEAAEGHHRQALALGGTLSMRPLLAHVHLDLGELYRRTGDRAKADEYLTIARTMYREMDLSFWLTRAEAALRSPSGNSP